MVGRNGMRRLKIIDEWGKKKKEEKRKKERGKRESDKQTDWQTEVVGVVVGGPGNRWWIR